ncbi:MAG: MBOAT family O-acyltransferase [Candidatus Melainabacteria bacterium]|nr:MBOAT family O-acyltransferase [Candidatus Melainabacteria bacterium]
MSMLLLASYFFYMCWIPSFVFLIFGMTVFNWIMGNSISRASTHKKLLFGVGIAINLLTLAVFKYANFLLGSVGLNDWHMNIVLPLAISFFIFEFIHYLFEINKGNKPISSFILFALFAAFFPTQIAGPIKRYADFEKQMKEETKFQLTYLDEGIPLIIVGFAKKILLADTLAEFVSMGYVVPGSFGSLELWLFAYAFAFQIYFDFSGYTDIARGSAMLFGYNIPINFNMPYIASNISNFWHRWHISLSSWLRDYLFIPLGGSRNGHWQTNRNLFITMTLGGLWHGASWNFVVWGIYHGLVLIAHREFNAVQEKFVFLKDFFQSKIGNFLSIVLTFHIVCVGWVFFRLQNIQDAFFIVKRMLCFSPVFTAKEATSKQFLLLQDHLPVIVVVSLILTTFLLISNLPLSIIQENGILKKIPAPFVGAFCLILVFIMVVFLPDGNEPFIYFQF